MSTTTTTAKGQQSQPRQARPSRTDYELYERLKAQLTSKATTAEEYEAAVRKAARLAGV